MRHFELYECVTDLEFVVHVREGSTSRGRYIVLTSHVVYCLMAFRRLASIILVAILGSDHVDMRACVDSLEVVEGFSDMCRVQSVPCLSSRPAIQ